MSRPVDRAALERERDFLLGSITDLDNELAAGNLSDDQHQRMVGSYTARAAAVLRALEQHASDDIAHSGTQTPRQRGGRVVVAGALAAVAALGMLVLPAAVRDRSPGQTITGNTQSAQSAQSAGEPSGEALARAVEQDPDSAQPRLAYARFLLDQGDVGEAVRQFDAAVQLDPDNPEALAYSGWILVLAGASDPDGTLGDTFAGMTERGLERIDKAIAADPDYPDAHVFRGLTLLRTGHPNDAVTALERYLELAPDGPLGAEVRSALDQARREADTK